MVIMLYLWERVINAFKTTQDEWYDKEIDDILDSFAKDAEQHGMGEYVIKDEKVIKWSGALDELCRDYLEEFKEDTLFDELAERLAYRDFEQRFGRMPDFRNNEQDYNDFGVIREMWDDEFEEFGLKRLNV